VDWHPEGDRDGSRESDGDAEGIADGLGIDRSTVSPSCAFLVRFTGNSGDRAHDWMHAGVGWPRATDKEVWRVIFCETVTSGPIERSWQIARCRGAGLWQAAGMVFTSVFPVRSYDRYMGSDR